MALPSRENDVDKNPVSEKSPEGALHFLFKFLLLIYIVLGSMFWMCWTFLLSWGAADKPQSFSSAVMDEINRGSFYTYAWCFHTALIGVSIICFSVLLLLRVTGFRAGAINQLINSKTK